MPFEPESPPRYRYDCASASSQASVESRQRTIPDADNGTGAEVGANAGQSVDMTTRHVVQFHDIRAVIFNERF
ncbi:hypothetical protein EDD11_000508 [Mortierella claussenii]|nr:hypothetical protein EDD11_000508 [Mortierella claussenii]